MNCQPSHGFRPAIAAVLISVVMAATQAFAANVVIVNLDQAGVGLNDNTPATPVGGNNGTTLGQQRMNLVQRAASIWGSRLVSSVPIRVGVQFAGAFACAQNPGDFVYLAFAGPSAYYTTNPPPDPPHPIVYPTALRNAILGTVADPSTPEISMRINPLMDSQPGCISGTTGFWYGISPDIAPPGNATRYPLLPLVLHEMAHGLGFVQNHNLQNGSGFPPYYYTFDTRVFDNTLGLFWTQMSDNQVLFSAANDPNVIWKGPNVDAVKSTYLRKPLRLRIDATAQPGEVAQAFYGPLLPATGLAGMAALVNDGSANPGEGCGTVLNATQVQGRIAVVKRGTCGFEQKTRNAAQAGAVAVLILNNRAETPGDPLPVAGGFDYTLHIPTATVAYQTGLTLLSQLSATPNAVVTVEPIPGSSLLGIQTGFMRLHAPAQISQGSSISHFTSDTGGPLLMQAEVSPTLFDRLDMTPESLRDIGWTILPDDRIFRNGFEN
ncbi:MAG TPA: PA domain-containing protein [Dokdonella sp.]|uniref:PA domain-containing protein n=1 Tax=Dokdonella sp. TaxID=2291710 RepID=UPI002D80DB85|nr:PA domain-containing protein [Dokdonella sp.]HET9033796.1 PA domain-containing protein [Dokdonella sp.]